MRVSLQRLGDNPRDHDADPAPLDPSACDVAGLKPDTTEEEWLAMESSPSNGADAHKTDPWKIYPPPPPPHWHPAINSDKPSTNLDASRRTVAGNEEFKFEECEIPGSDSWEYAIDDRGVFQIYTSNAGITYSLIDSSGRPPLLIWCLL